MALVGELAPLVDPAPFTAPAPQQRAAKSTPAGAPSSGNRSRRRRGGRGAGSAGRPADQRGAGRGTEQRAARAR
jgi:hypothetical protein